MMESPFTTQVLKSFRYLLDEYQFEIIHDDSQDMFDGWIVFASGSTFVGVFGEHAAVGAPIGRRRDFHKKDRPEISWRTIYQFRFFSPEEKKLVCSHDPADEHTATGLLFLPKLYERKRSEDVVEDISFQIDEEAKNVKKYGDFLLRGDFSQWLEIFEFKVAMQMAEYARKHHKEYSVADMRIGSDGKLFEKRKRTMWQDYLEELRREYGK
jgi:hypothetical protein